MGNVPSVPKDSWDFYRDIISKKGTESLLTPKAKIFLSLPLEKRGKLTNEEFGLEDYNSLYDAICYSKGPRMKLMGPIDDGDHIPLEIMDFCSDGTLNIKALDKYTPHLQGCKKCQRNYSAYFPEQPKEKKNCL